MGGKDTTPSLCLVIRDNYKISLVNVQCSIGTVQECCVKGIHPSMVCFGEFGWEIQHVEGEWMRSREEDVCCREVSSMGLEGRRLWSWLSTL